MSLLDTYTTTTPFTNMMSSNDATFAVNNMVSPSPSTPSSTKTKSCRSPSSKKKSTSLPAETVDYLKAWMMSPEHIAHPYPTEQEKAQIMADTGIELKQLTNWFVNNRKRYWKPRVEARLQQQVQLPVAPAAAGAIKRRSSSISSAASMSQPMTLATTTATTPSSTAAFDANLSALSSLGAAALVKKDTPQFVRNSSQESLAAISSLVAGSFLASSPAAAQLLQTQQLLQQEEQIVVSDASSSSSCASDAASDFSSANDDTDEAIQNFDVDHEDSSLAVATANDASVARTETVDVHILRPLNGVRPTIADVSILSTVPRERILCTYENVLLTYRFNMDAIQDRKKVQNRRDAEIVRLKRKFLKLFLEEGGMDVAVAPKRDLPESETDQTPRKKFRRESFQMWRDACVTAQDTYDHDLPTLEEAALLFGFSRGISA